MSGDLNLNTVYIIIGPQGCGKDTQAQLLYERFGLVNLTTGGLLKEIARTDTNIARLLKMGTLIDDTTVNQLVFARLDLLRISGQAALLNGYPRTVVQLEALLGYALTNGKRLVAVSMELPVEQLCVRVLRRVTGADGKIYNLDTNPPPPGMVVTKRIDDEVPAFVTRLLAYYSQTVPVVQMLDRMGLLTALSVNQKSPQEVFGLVASALHL